MVRARNVIRWGLVVVALVVVGVALRLTVLRPRPVEVMVARVERGRVEAIVVNSRAGTVKSRQRAQLSPGISGEVVALPVREGQRVAKGDLLLRIRESDLRAQVDVARRALGASRSAEREAIVALAQAESALVRNRALAREGAIPEAALEELQSRRDAAAASVDAARARAAQASAQIDASGALLEKSVLVAPFDGIVAALAVKEGEWTSPQPPGVLIPAAIDLFDPDSIYISVPLDEVDLGKIRVGMAVRVSVDAVAETNLAGRIARIAPYVEDRLEQNRTFEVEVELEDQAAARALRPGSTADIEVILEARENVLRIPTSALMEGDRVLVVRDGRLVAVTVPVGLRNWEVVEVTGGLREGDEVVTSLDRAEVKEGVAVTTGGVEATGAR